MKPTTPSITIRTEAECMLRASMGAVSIEHQHHFKEPHVLFREPLCHAGQASGHFEAQVVMLQFLMNWTLEQLEAGGFEPSQFSLRVVSSSKSLIQKLQAAETAVATTKVSGILRECREAGRRFESISYV